MERWVLAAVWVSLPLTAGAAVADVLDDWSTAPAVIAAVLCWSAWALGLLTIVVPRPVGLTAIRTIAPVFAVVGTLIVIDGSASTAASVTGLIATVVAAVLVARPALAFAAVNGAAYGDESRTPLRVPPALFLGLLPAARLLLAAAVVTGPLLLADGQWVAGALAVVVGAPIAVFAARALHGLSARWAVLVPAGFVIVDPLTLSDPVLFLRERIVSLRATGPEAPASADALDLRLGAGLGTCALLLDRPTEVFRTPRGRRSGVTTVKARDIRIAVLRRPQLLAEAAHRRIPVVAEGVGRARFQAAKPPPTSTSSS